jgi:hypothetical protein
MNDEWLGGPGACELPGSYFNLTSYDSLLDWTDVAWSNLRVSRGTRACSP